MFHRQPAILSLLNGAPFSILQNFPFCTIDPNEARVNVPDERFNWLCDVYKPKSAVPAFLEVWDIAGLVKGASEGAGLGNAFLSNISAVDGIFHVCRAFDDADVVHVEDRINPIDDLEIIHGELRAKDIATVTSRIEALEKLKNRGMTKVLLMPLCPDDGVSVRVILRSSSPMPQDQKDALECAQSVLAHLEEGKDVRLKTDWTAKEVDWLNETMLLTAKPVVYLVNLSEVDYKRKKNKWLPKIFEWVQAHGGEPIVPFSGALEATLADMPEDEAAVRRER